MLFILKEIISCCHSAKNVSLLPHVVAHKPTRGPFCEKNTLQGNVFSYLTSEDRRNSDSSDEFEADMKSNGSDERTESELLDSRSATPIKDDEELTKIINSPEKKVPKKTGTLEKIKNIPSPRTFSEQKLSRLSHKIEGNPYDFEFDESVYYPLAEDTELCLTLNNKGLEFAKRLQIYRGPAFELLKGTNVAGLVLVAYPDAKLEEAQLITDWIISLFAIDDKVDAKTLNKKEWTAEYDKQTEEGIILSKEEANNVFTYLNRSSDITEFHGSTVSLYRYLETLDENIQIVDIFEFQNELEDGLLYDSKVNSDIGHLKTIIKKSAIEVTLLQIVDFNEFKIHTMEQILKQFDTFIMDDENKGKEFQISSELQDQVAKSVTNHVKAVVDVYCRMLNHLHQKVPNKTSEQKIAAMSEFQKTFREYLESVVDEKEQEKDLESMTEFGASRIRESACGADHAVRVLSNLRGIKIDDFINIRNIGYSLKNILNLVNLHIEWVNDVLSYQKEKLEYLAEHSSEKHTKPTPFIKTPSFNYLHWVIADMAEEANEEELEQKALTIMTSKKIPEFTNNIYSFIDKIKINISAMSKGTAKKAHRAKITEETAMEINSFLLHLKGWMNQVLWAKECYRYNLISGLETEQSMKSISASLQENNAVRFRKEATKEASKETTGDTDRDSF